MKHGRLEVEVVLALLSRGEGEVAEAERAKAAAQAKAAEDARLAAEKTKKVEEAKAEAERLAAENKKRTLEQAKATEAERAKAAAQAKAEVDAKLAADQAKVTDEKKPQDHKPVGQLAALTPPDQAGESPPKPDSPASDMPRLLQTELRRIGCNTGAIDGNWNIAAQKSLERFNKIARTNFDVKAAGLDALDAVRSKTGRICPLTCDHGYEPKGETCVKISCKQGYRVGDNNVCEKIESKTAVSKRESSPEPQPQRPASKPTASASAGGTCRNWFAICSSRAGSTPSICSQKYASCLGSGCWTEGKSYGGAEHCALKR